MNNLKSLKSECFEIFETAKNQFFLALIDDLGCFNFSRLNKDELSPFYKNLKNGESIELVEQERSFAHTQYCAMPQEGFAKIIANEDGLSAEHMSNTSFKIFFEYEPMRAMRINKKGLKEIKDGMINYHIARIEELTAARMIEIAHDIESNYIENEPVFFEIAREHSKSGRDEIVFLSDDSYDFLGKRK